MQSFNFGVFRITTVIMDDLDVMDPVDDLFDEDYQDGEDSEDSEDDGDDHKDQADDEVAEMSLDISEVQATANYKAAGKEVEEEQEKITIAGNAHLMSTEVNALLDKVVEKLDMPYKPAEFQRVAINALGEQKNVILVSPTGSGKMNVPLLATLVLREKLKNPKSVYIVTQPLTSIMNEKMRNDICKVAVLSMAGDLKTSMDDEDDDVDDAKLSCGLQELLAGHFPVLFGHPESFDSKLG